MERIHGYKRVLKNGQLRAMRALQTYITRLNASDGKGVSGEEFWRQQTAGGLPTVTTVYRQEEGYSTTKLKR